jgi:hypothetical protein
MRLLLNPAPTDGGGATPPPAPEVKPTPAPVPTPPVSDPAAAMMAELAALRSQLNEFNTEKAAREQAKRQEEEQAAIRKGEFEKLLKQRESERDAEKARANEAIERSKGFALDRELAMALSRPDLMEYSAEELTALWRKDFEVVADDRGGWKVQTKDFRPLAEVVAERLGSPRYAKHLKAESRGGGGGGSGTRPAPTPNPGESATPPGSPAEWMRQILGERAGTNLPFGISRK